MSKADNKELEEAIKTLREIQESNRSWLKETKEENCEKMYLRDIEAIETVLKELERLQEENSKLERANKTYINSIQSITPVLLEDYIAKDKIREEIKELQNMKIDGEVFITSKNFAIKTLQELLEGK